MIQDSDFDYLQKFFLKESGYQLMQEKEYLLKSCLQDTMATYRIDDLTQLVKQLQTGETKEALRHDVVQAMTINETMFFRDKTVFTRIEKHVLPEIVKNSASRHITIWCTACSSGQEPYSLAMMIQANRHLYPGYQFDILATDLSEAMVERAKSGIYSTLEVTRSLPDDMRAAYFDQIEDNKWKVSDAIRNMVRFKPHNLLAMPYEGGPFDLILCRNVMIYFDEAQKKKILAALRKVNRNPGFLLAGVSEMLSGLTQEYKMHPEWNGVYQATHATLST